MNFHRYYFPGQIVFITQNVKDKKPEFNNPELISLLINTLHNTKERYPFKMLAYVFLPDHFHLLIQPQGKTNFSKIMHSLKFNFTRAYKKKIGISYPLNFWQKRFWDHVIRDETDLENHIHYIHYNPVTHGYVNDPSEWQTSSYKSWAMRDAYPQDSVWCAPKESKWGE